ncbi:hypothetical protein Vadar_015243 [Vaccinium darrowii]|uniref:Uncharacterized protein n=1 Tax=Vaccinium darrowii TaxID=229202 RepID=A0ACB7XS34_9ERIC|nr:hypothetical protein Vadar_015243 [Vaccinium darrowii]
MKRSGAQVQKKRSRKIAPTTIFSIPVYILMEILSKLPVFTICNCRCVCSFFRNLISDPQFVRLHLSRSRSSLVITNVYSVFSLYLVESVDPLVVDSDINGKISIPSNTLPKFKPKCDVPTGGLDVLSSCNGLICFHCTSTYDPYVICNPVISEYVIVAQMEKAFYHHCGSGFGFCLGTNEYKVLRFLSSRLGGVSKVEAEINTLGTKLWRRVGEAPLYLRWYSGGCFLNGALHWIVKNTENCFESMCCFDFGKEQFQPFPVPSEFCGLPGQIRVDVMNLGVLNDGLSLCHRPFDYRLDIWMMKDYAVQESWTKVFVINPLVAPDVNLNYEPLMVLKNGDILMLFASSFMVSFDTRSRSYRKGETPKVTPV